MKAKTCPGHYTTPRQLCDLRGANCHRFPQAPGTHTRVETPTAGQAEWEAVSLPALGLAGFP